MAQRDGRTATVKVIQPLGGGAAIEPQLDTIGVLVYPYTNAVTQIRIELNPSLGVPIYRQIMDGIRDLIASGVLQPGDQLPSIREIASELRINPASAVKAYGELRHAGLIRVHKGRGTFVARRPSIVNETREELLHRDLQSVVARAKARGSTEEQILAAVRRTLRKRRRA